MQGDAGGRRREEAEFYNSRFLASERIRLAKPLDFVLQNWYLFAAAIASGTLLLMPMLQQAGGGGRVSAADAVQIINREKGVLIDVSEPAEYAAAPCRRREERAAGHARDLARAAEEQVAAAGDRLPHRQSRAARPRAC